MSRMLWFTWRQQRTTAIGAAAAVAALPVSLVSLNSPTWPGGAVEAQHGSRFWQCHAWPACSSGLLCSRPSWSTVSTAWR